MKELPILSSSANTGSVPTILERCVILYQIKELQTLKVFNQKTGSAAAQTGGSGSVSAEAAAATFPNSQCKKQSVTAAFKYEMAADLLSDTLY